MCASVICRNIRQKSIELQIKALKNSGPEPVWFSDTVFVGGLCRVG